jgi:hypothetical protein
MAAIDESARGREDSRLEHRLVGVIRESGNQVFQGGLHMSDDREMNSGRNADETAPDEEVKLHIKDGGRKMDDSPGAQDDDNDVEAHVKNKL